MTEQERISTIQWMEFLRIASDNTLATMARANYEGVQDFRDILDAELERRDTERRLKEKYDAE